MIGDEKLFGWCPWLCPILYIDNNNNKKKTIWIACFIYMVMSKPEKKKNRSSLNKKKTKNGMANEILWLAISSTAVHQPVL